MLAMVKACTQEFLLNGRKCHNIAANYVANFVLGSVIVDMLHLWFHDIKKRVYPSPPKATIQRPGVSPPSDLDARLNTARACFSILHLIVLAASAAFSLLLLRKPLPPGINNLFRGLSVFSSCFSRHPTAMQFRTFVTFVPRRSLSSPMFYSWPSFRALA